MFKLPVVIACGSGGKVHDGGQKTLKIVPGDHVAGPLDAAGLDPRHKAGDFRRILGQHHGRAPGDHQSHRQGKRGQIGMDVIGRETVKSLTDRAPLAGMQPFGPQGALPLNTTEEVLRWQTEGENGFVRFTDILSARFYQLFFRAWSDAHAISQHDRPDEDRFGTYVAAVAGLMCRQAVTVDDMSPVATSFPGFEGLLRRLAR